MTRARGKPGKVQVESYRRMRLEKKAQVLSNLGVKFDALAAMGRVASPVIGPAAVVENADFRSQLERAVGELAEPYRTIVILREIQDFRYEEICEALSLPLNTVKVYLHRARRKLREKLREFASHGTT